VQRGLINPGNRQISEPGGGGTLTHHHFRIDVKAGDWNCWLESFGIPISSKQDAISSQNRLISGKITVYRERYQRQ